MTREALAALWIAVIGIGGCASTSSPSTGKVRPDDFSGCTDHYRKCRDRCAPAGVKEAACFRNDMGEITRVCTCDDDAVHHSNASGAAMKGTDERQSSTTRAESSYALSGRPSACSGCAN